MPARLAMRQELLRRRRSDYHSGRHQHRLGHQRLRHLRGAVLYPGNLMHSAAGEARITVRNLTMAYGSFVLMRDLNFTVQRGDIFIIMGGSGSGKSTLVRHMIGLNEPASGEVWYGGENFTAATQERR